MKKLAFESILYIFVFLMALFVPQPVFAHGGEPRIEISAARLSPGETLQVHGVDFEYDAEVTLALIGNQVEISLGTLIADAEGVFIQNVLLPDSLAEGTYAVRARTYDHVVISPTITIWGMAITDQEDSAFRDQSDVQLGPLPTFTAEEATMPSVPVNQPPASSGSWNANLPILAGSFVVAVVLLLGFMRYKKAR